MNVLRILLTLSVLFFCEKADAKGKIVLKAEMEKLQKYSGDVVINFTVVNGRNEVVYHSSTVPIKDVKFFVFYPDGRKVELTNYGKNWWSLKSGGAGNRRVATKIEPGSSLKFSPNIGRVFDMSMGGKYVVKNSITLYDAEGKKFTVEGENLTIEIPG